MAWRSSSVPFAALNHGKRSVALDAEDPGAAAARAALLDWADVLICDDGPDQSGWRPDLDGGAELVQCVMSGFGGDGPWRGRAWSELGHSSRPRRPRRWGTPAGPRSGSAPTRPACSPGTYASQGIAAALVAGEFPCRVDVSLGAMLTMRSTLWAARSNPDEWWGFHLDSYVKPPFHGYQAKDGLVFMAFRMAADLQWDAVVREFGMDWWEVDPRAELFREDSIGPGLSRYGYLVHDLWERALAPFTVEEVIAKVESFGGNAFPMLTYRQLLADEQLAAVAAVDGAGGVPRIRSPWRFDGEEPAQSGTVVPELGADGAEVLTAAWPLPASTSAACCPAACSAARTGERTWTTWYCAAPMSSTRVRASTPSPTSACATA